MFTTHPWGVALGIWLAAALLTTAWFRRAMLRGRSIDRD